MIIFSVLAKIGTLLLITGVIYLFYLALVGFLSKEKEVEFEGKFNFLILVPAHNEGKSLVDTIVSLKDIHKTGEDKIVVVADNCDDDTAQIARDHGVEVLERNEPTLRGKGYALRWAMDQYNLDDFNAVAIIDADTIVEQNILPVMATSLSSGFGAIQLNNMPYLKDNSPLVSLQYIASLTENYLFYKPRSVLRLPVLLRGTGMAIRSDVLQKHPWDSHSITEDVDYAVNILKEGYKITFSTQSKVSAKSPESFDQAMTQKKRWSSGTFGLIADNFGALIKTGIGTKNYGLVELAFSLFLLSRPTMIYFSTLMIIFTLLGSPPNQNALIGVNIILISLIIIYIFSGALLSKNRMQLLSAIPLIPFYGVWYLLVQIRSLFGFRKSEWVRTERKSDE
jgi:cellulose synthase/poly-beta-1,6-N-acetylglucosamine synthase-like glycosyltransferase